MFNHSDYTYIHYKGTLMPASQVAKLKAREAQKQVTTVEKVETSDEETLLEQYVRIVGKNPSPRYKKDEEYLSKAIADKLAETSEQTTVYEEAIEAISE